MEYDYVVKNNDTIESILRKFSVKQNEINFIVEKIKKNKLSGITPDQKMKFVLKRTKDKKEMEVLKINYPLSKTTFVNIDKRRNKIEITKEKLSLTIPTNQQGNLRALSSLNQVNKAISILKGKAKIKRTMWSRRAQEYEQKINSGEIYQIAEVVRDLNKNTDMPVDQSYSERQLFEKAYERLLGEVIAVLNIDEEAGKLKLNKALGKKPEVVQTSTPI